MTEVLGERGKRIYNYLTGTYDAQINFHVDSKTEVIWKDLQEMFKRNGMKTTPHAGIFVISVSKMVADAFFNDAERLGINPMEYSEERLITMLNAIKKVNTGITNVEKTRTNTVKQIDNKYTLKLQAMVAGK